MNKKDLIAPPPGEIEQAVSKFFLDIDSAIRTEKALRDAGEHPQLVSVNTGLLSSAVRKEIISQLAVGRPQKVLGCIEFTDEYETNRTSLDGKPLYLVVTPYNIRISEESEIKKPRV